jgi:asparagine synthase (glutamine-hydrolysing)
MCGILGGFSDNEINKEKLDHYLSTINHRGPDSKGSFISYDRKLYLGHTRLAILDLSKAGSQPMISSNNRYVITYNGEIYNFNEIKQKILGLNPSYVFKSSGDTEIILAAIETFGFKKSIAMMQGMFAIGVWDKSHRKLFLARDRIGEKPLYYGVINNSFFFASELKALSFFSELRIDSKALNLFLAQGNVPAPFSIFKNIYKMEPGTFLVAKTPSDFDIHKYWKPEHFLDISLNSFDKNYEIFENLFLKSVESQMISDVRLGAFLSGGLDSSAVVSAMSELSDTPVETHTIGYSENAYDESNAAREIANYLGTNHHEFILSPDDAKSIIPKLSHLYCEPFADSSQIPTYFLAKQTRKNVVVSLSGDGGDELFGGYNRYIFFNRFQKIINAVSPKSRIRVSKIIKPIMQNKITSQMLSIVFHLAFNSSNAKEKIEKILKLLEQDSLEDIYFSLLQQWHFDEWPLHNKHSIDPKEIYHEFLTIPVTSFREMRLMDLKNYLPNDILVKLDRASMAVSLESRVPFLDQKLVEFALNLPSDQLVKRGKGKLMIRKFLASRIPKNILNLPKSGFGVPIEEWLFNDLKSWAKEIIFSDKEDQLFDYVLLEKLWNEHEQGILLHHHKMWSILMLKLWLSNNQRALTI